MKGYNESPSEIGWNNTRLGKHIKKNKRLNDVKKFSCLNKSTMGPLFMQVTGGS